MGLLHTLHPPSCCALHSAARHPPGRQTGGKQEAGRQTAGRRRAGRQQAGREQQSSLCSKSRQLKWQQKGRLQKEVSKGSTAE